MDYQWKLPNQGLGFALRTSRKGGIFVRIEKKVMTSLGWFELRLLSPCHGLLPPTVNEATEDTVDSILRVSRSNISA